MYSAFNSNITTHLDSFRQMKPSFLINSANENIYSFVSHITVSIILVKYDLLLRDNYGFRTGYFSYKAGRSGEWTSSGGQLQYQQHWPGRSATGTERRNQRWRQGAGEGILAKRGSFPGDQVMPGKDLQTLAWDPPGTLVLSSLLH